MHSTRFMIDFQLSVSRLLQSVTRTQQLNSQATTSCENCRLEWNCRDVQPQISKRRLMQDTGRAYEYNCDATAFDCKLQTPHDGR